MQYIHLNIDKDKYTYTYVLYITPKNKLNTRSIRTIGIHEPEKFGHLEMIPLISIIQVRSRREVIIIHSWNYWQHYKSYMYSNTIEFVPLYVVIYIYIYIYIYMHRTSSNCRLISR